MAGGAIKAGKLPKMIAALEKLPGVDPAKLGQLAKAAGDKALPLIDGLVKRDVDDVVKKVAPIRGAGRLDDILSGVPGRVTGRFDAVTPGPLGNTLDDVAATFSGGRYAVIELDETVTLYRAWHPGGAREFGGFWSLEQPLGSLPSRIDSALVPKWGNEATRWTAIRVPKGTKIYVGEVGNQGGLWVGGGSQILIEGGPQSIWKILEGVLK